MNDTVRLLAAGVTGSALTLLVLSGPPVLADGVDRAGGAVGEVGRKITSAQIKNGTVKGKDLSPEVAASLARADSALQEVPDGAVTTGSLADGAVTEDKLAEQSVGSPQVRPNSLAAQDLAAGSVGASEVGDGSLSTDEVSSDHGVVVLDFPELAPGACGAAPEEVEVLNPLSNDLVLVSVPSAVPGAVRVDARVAGTSRFEVWACNLSADPQDLPQLTYGYAVIEN